MIKISLGIFIFILSLIIPAQGTQITDPEIQTLQLEINNASDVDRTKLEDSLVKILIDKADLNFLKKNYKDAINFYHQAIPIYEKRGNLNALSICYSSLGASYSKVSNYDKSQMFYFKSLDIEEEKGNEKGIAVNLEKIGEIYLLTGDLDKATNNFEEAIEIYKGLNDERGIIYNLTNLGASNQKSGNIEVAIELYKDGLARAEKIGLKRSQSILLGNIGSSNRSLNNYQESLDYLFRALDLKLELKRYGSAAHSCSDIAETYIMMGDFESARNYAKRAVELAKNENLNEEKFANYLLSKINYELGDYKEAYVHYSNYNQLRDSLFTIQKISNINEMQIKYETEKQELMIAAQKSDIELLNEKNKVKNQYIVFGALGSLSIFGFILLIRSRNREKQKKFMQVQFSRDLLASQETERNRIAKDLHDSVGQQLTLIKKKSQNVDQEEISQLTNNALEEVRSISRGLYPATLRLLGITESIEQLVLDLDEDTHLFFSAEIDNIDDCFSEEENLNIYRFIQESLNNVIKHANAKAVEVNIERKNEIVELIINDNGKGFDHSAKMRVHSLGLKTLEERIQILGGEFTIESEPGTGTSIKAKIPIR